MDQGVGHVVKRLREERAWSQAKLAVEADMSVSGVSMIENGQRNLTTTTLAKLAKAFGVEIADLFPKVQPSLPNPPQTRRFDQVAQAAKGTNAWCAREVQRGAFTEADYDDVGKVLNSLDNLLMDTVYEPISGTVSEERLAILNQALREAASAVDDLRGTLALAREALRDRKLREQGVPKLHEYGAPQASRLLRTDNTRRSEAG